MILWNYEKAVNQAIGVLQAADIHYNHNKHYKNDYIHNTVEKINKK